MGRRATETIVQEKPVIDSERLLGELAQRMKSETETRENVQALVSRLGYEGSLMADSLEEGIRESHARVNLELFAIGARLLLLKELCPHGDFSERCERLGYEGRMVRRMMQATLKFSNRPTSAGLIQLGKSKLFELVVLDDEEITEFAEGGFNSEVQEGYELSVAGS